MSRHLFAAWITSCSALLALGNGVGARAEEAASPSHVRLSPAPAGAPAIEGEDRIWISQGPSDPGPHESLSVKYIPEYAAQGPITFDCDARCDDAIAEGIVRLKIRDSSGKALFAAENTMALAAGSNVSRFEWPTADLPDGEYTAQFTLIHSPGMFAAGDQLRIRKLGRSTLQQEMERAAGRVASIKQHLDQLAEKNDKPSYGRVRILLAEDALAESGRALASSQWPVALDLVRYASRTADSIGAQLALMDSSSELLQTVPEPELSSLGRLNGGFESGEQPVFLVGVSSPSADADRLSHLRRYGLNLYAFALGPANTLVDEKRAAELGPSLDAFFSEAKKLNVSLACALSPNPLPEWALRKWPDLRQSSLAGASSVNLSDGPVQSLVERHVRAALTYLSRQPMVNSVALVQRPAFEWGGDAVRAGFTAYATEIYKDRDALNAAWRKRLRVIDDVDIWWDYSRSSYQYDWQTYHAQLGSEYLANLNASAKSVAPGMAFRVDVTDKVLQNGKREAALKRETGRRAQTLDDPRDVGVGRGESAQGVDRESIAKVFDVNGCESTAPMHDAVYSMNYPSQSLLYTLLRSFAPDKPLLDSNMDLAPEGGLDGAHAYQYIHSALWDAALSGVNGVAVRAEIDSAGVWGGVFAMPESREALAIARLDLNRLAPVVAAFQRAPADVAILWSMPSKIYEKGYPYLPSVRRAYEGCSFCGRKVRFISENQCVQQGLDGVAFLVLPQMLAVSEATFHVIQEYVKGGGVIIRSGSPIPYNERGASRQAVVGNSIHTILVRGVDSPSQYLHALDAAFALGTVEDVPRVVNDEGYPMEGVKTSFTEFGGERYLYLLNLRTTTVRCQLQGRTQSGRDLIQGRDVTFPRLVMPLEPMLIRLNHVDAAPAPALAAIDSEPHTTVVRPVEAPKSDLEKKKVVRGGVAAAGQSR